jgi:phosphodiesterase/alkaline phosphatase D-like protein
MKTRTPVSVRRTMAAVLAAAGVFLAAPPAMAALSFPGVAAGDASSTEATFWTRAVDGDAPASTALTLEISTDPAFAGGVATVSGTTDSTKDYTCKLDVSGLSPATLYYYRFAGPAEERSIVGKVKTAPAPSTSAPVHFAFSGDNDGAIRPFALAGIVALQDLDFYINLGDVIYESASNLTLSGPHNGAPWLNSPPAAPSNSALNLNGVPAGGTSFATQAQLRADYSRKYRENFLPVNNGGQNSLQVLYAAQGNYTTWDNHELGNRKYIDGGAPAGGPVGGPMGTDMATGAGVDARNNGQGNPRNINDVNLSRADFMNRSTGFATLRDTFLSYQPIANRGTVKAPADPRSNGTPQLYSANQWGKNAIYINTDARSYRDIRLKTANAAADDTSAPRANNPGRTCLGATQLAWLERTLLTAQAAGTTWKFVSISDPIDQIGPVGGALALNHLPDFGLNSAYSPVNADGGKSYIGGYRAERNALLKFIADNVVTNVVFLATDDHQNRINELTYSPSGDTENQASYVKVPYCFSIVCGPLGASGPNLITNHTFEMARQYADSLFAAQQAAGVEPLGLMGYPGLHDLQRAGDPAADISPRAVDFYSPDTFNFTLLDVSAGGGTLTVSSVGMFATALNAGIEYSGGPPATTLFSFQIDADTEKPVIHRVSPSKNVLSPPNHKMVPVTLTVSATDDREVASIRIVNVTSNEAPYRKGRGNGREKGHGNRPVDWQLTGGLNLQLRAERTGGGPGRVYTITVEASDKAGNKTQKSTTVTVPH